jgi:hypothetical protein
MRWLIWLSVVVVVAAVTVFYLHPLWVNDQWVRAGLRMHGVQSDQVEIAIPAGKFRIHYYVVGEGQPAARTGRK